MFAGIAFTLIFPVWAGQRLVRRFTGMEGANKDRLARAVGSWSAAVFAGVHRLHELLRPVLGCGLTNRAPALTDGSAAAAPPQQ